MAAWITLDKSYLLSRLLNAEVVALSNLKESTQEDPVEKAIEVMCQEIYGSLSAGGYTVPEYAAVPKELERTALALIAWDALARVPGAAMLQTDARKDARDEARKILERVAAGKFKVTPLDTEEQATEQPTGNVSPTFTGRKKRDRWIS